MTLTVKQINIDLSEEVFEVKNIKFSDHKLYIYTTDGWTMVRDSGTFYIMNDKGNTISKYTLWKND
jgi:hypothetical protein